MVNLAFGGPAQALVEVDGGALVVSIKWAVSKIDTRLNWLVFV